MILLGFTVTLVALGVRTITMIKTLKLTLVQEPATQTGDPEQNHIGMALPPPTRVQDKGQKGDLEVGRQERGLKTEATNNSETENRKQVDPLPKTEG